MRVTFWGTRGSLATPDPDMTRFGGNTSCVEVRGDDGSVLVLDAGTGIRRLGRTLAGATERVDILLTHLHMDHIQGLGFFAPLFQPGLEVHIWGPPSATQALPDRLARYLSPPLFPIHLRDAASRLTIHDLDGADLEIGDFRVGVSFVCHPNPTVGFRIMNGGSVVTYLPDHEPALGDESLSRPTTWISGLGLASSSDVLIHDSQYSTEEYPSHRGWGHSSIEQAMEFGRLAEVRMLVPFHHDPSHSDGDLVRLMDEAQNRVNPPFAVVPAQEGATIVLDGHETRVLAEQTEH